MLETETSPYIFRHHDRANRKYKQPERLHITLRRLQAVSDCWQLCAFRWEASTPASIDNLVLMTFDEADQHEAQEHVNAPDANNAHKQYVQQRLQLVRTDYAMT